MTIYSHIEERYCSRCGRNVGIEYTHTDDGTIVKRCLTKACESIPGNTETACFFNNTQSGGTEESQSAE